MIHHVQVACPVGGEAAQRMFYGDALGWDELPKPPVLAQRGGCWFRVLGVGGPDGELHVGVDHDFRAATKAHPAFLVDVDVGASAPFAAGCPAQWADPTAILGRRQFHCRRCWRPGEFLDRAASSGHGVA